MTKKGFMLFEAWEPAVHSFRHISISTRQFSSYKAKTKYLYQKFREKKQLEMTGHIFLKVCLLPIPDSIDWIQCWTNIQYSKGMSIFINWPNIIVIYKEKVSKIKIYSTIFLKNFFSWNWFTYNISDFSATSVNYPIVTIKR